MININRRAFLATTTFATGAVSALAKAAKASKWDRTRLSAITDEIATAPGGAIAFAKLYNLKWLVDIQFLQF